MGNGSRVVALIVLCASLSAAVLGVRHAMQARRARARQTWSQTLQCLSRSRSVPRRCAELAHRAEEAIAELPEHGRQELELTAALADLAKRLERGDAEHLQKAVDRVAEQGSALGFARPANQR